MEGIGLLGSFARPSLAERLRELRQQVPGVTVTQKQVADALGLSVPLVSSWESGKAVPQEERLRRYALLFSTPRYFVDGGSAVPDESELTSQEEVRRRELIEELFALREDALRGTTATTRQTGALGGRFWYFPQDARIRIITTPMFNSVIENIPYANKWHPNFMEFLHDADRDATMELFGHIRAENPAADVKCLTADQATHDDLTGFVVILGQGDSFLAPFGPWSSSYKSSDGFQQTVVEYLFRRLELPVGTRLPKEKDEEFDGEFLVTTDAEGTATYFPAGIEPSKLETYRPVFLRDENAPGRPRRRVDGLPQLEYDVALLARKRNELNIATTVTICSGVFSRGTYGAVRALTDAALRTRNEQFLAEHMTLDDFWMLLHVPIFAAGVSGAETITPDLARPFHRLRSSS
jgi:transcriptional regulator with XRE-family HTH domain